MGLQAELRDERDHERQLEDELCDERDGNMGLEMETEGLHAQLRNELEYERQLEASGAASIAHARQLEDEVSVLKRQLDDAREEALDERDEQARHCCVQ